MDRLVHGVLVLLALLGSASGGGRGSAQRLVAFAWTGGISGHNEHLWIDTLGRGRLSVGPPTQPVIYKVAVRGRRLVALRAAIAAARISSLNPDLAAPPDVQDGFVYNIEVPGGSVTFGDGGPSVPAPVGRLTERLRAIVDGVVAAGGGVVHHPAASGKNRRERLRITACGRRFACHG
jgi:hypothetical protein